VDVDIDDRDARRLPLNESGWLPSLAKLFALTSLWFRNQLGLFDLDRLSGFGAVCQIAWVHS
jgi:hypothetical protein